MGQTCLGIRAYVSFSSSVSKSDEVRNGTDICDILQVPVCINTPWYTFTPPVQAAPGSVVPASQVPVPVMPSITSSCTQYELVGSGSDYRVESIVAKNGISMEQFLNWNQYVDRTYPTVWEGYWVCVSVA